MVQMTFGWYGIRVTLRDTDIKHVTSASEASVTLSKTGALNAYVYTGKAIETGISNYYKSCFNYMYLFLAIQLIT